MNETTTTNTRLSPAAQAVLDACNEAVERLPLTAEPEQFSVALIAAALRAAAPQMEFVQDHLKLLAIATEIEAEETASVSVKKQRPARLVVGDIWEFETEVRVKGKRKPQDVTLQWVVKGYHPGECAWQLQSLDGQHYVYLWEHAPQYEEMTYIGTQNND
jgi:hypothetical protein